MKDMIFVLLASLMMISAMACTPPVSPERSEVRSNASVSRSASEHQHTDDYLIVDCVYPPRIRTTGGLVTRIPRPPERITREQCLNEGGRPTSAQEAWGKKAEQGEVEALIHLADDNAIGVQRDCRQAEAYYQRAIQNAEAAGDEEKKAQASNALAYYYERGCEGVKDLRQAYELYREGHAPHERMTPDFGDFYALVIGNNRYPHFLDLQSPIQDAKEVKTVLTRQYDFRVELLLNATKRQILQALDDLRRELKGQDNLLIYYAGHGYLDEDNDHAYWVPVDAVDDDDNTWLLSDEVTKIVKNMQAKRVLIVSDACYSGAWARARTRRLFANLYRGKKLDFWLFRMSLKQTRLILTSGGFEQPVLDCDPEKPGCEHSVFARHFIKVLKENDKILIGRQLYQRLDLHVPYDSLGYTNQEPLYVPLPRTGHEGGEFFFVSALQE
jgi:hypothetical protein